MNIPGRKLVLALAIALLAASGQAREDHDEAKRLREAGDIMPLQQVLEHVSRDQRGRVVETELERERGRYIYEIKIVDQNGVVHELKYDAKTAQLLKREN